MPIQTLNPSTGQIEKIFDAFSTQDVEAKLAHASAAFLSWRALSLDQRADYLLRVAALLRTNAAAYAKVITAEMGKPITQAKAEIEKCAWNCEHYAQSAAAYLASEKIETDASESFVRFDPLGVILFVMPWNFPFWQVFRMAAPVLMAGNTILLKHASNVPQCALLIEQIFREAGLPGGVFSTLLIESGAVEVVLKDDRAKGVGLTGSEKAGTTVAAIAGAQMKPCVMELGGSDPFIVLADADVGLACEAACKARLLNGGQVCISSKRFIVHESLYQTFLEKLKASFEGYVVGDPMDDATQMGPLSSEKSREDLHAQVVASLQMGARLVTGGQVIDRVGWYYAPTIVADVTSDMPVWKEETFGPVLAVRSFESEDEAIALANDSRYGLGASIYSCDILRAKELAGNIESGMVFINGIVKTDPRLPTGGVKKSGIGRELGQWGIRAFTNVKTVWVK